MDVIQIAHKGGDVLFEMSPADSKDRIILKKRQRDLPQDRSSGGNILLHARPLYYIDETLGKNRIALHVFGLCQIRNACHAEDHKYDHRDQDPLFLPPGTGSHVHKKAKDKACRIGKEFALSVYKEHSNYAYSYTDPVEPPELKLLFVCQYEIETDQSAQRKYIVDKDDIPAQSHTHHQGAIHSCTGTARRCEA